MSDAAPIFQTKGALIGLPPAGEVAYFTDASGNFKQVDSSGNVTAVGSGALTVGTGLAGAGTVASPLVTAPTEYYASLTAGAATSLALSGLNGDADGDYLIRMYIKSAAAGSNTIKIQVNGADTNLYCVCSDPLHGGVAINSSWTIAVAGINPYTFSTGNWANLVGVFPARSGRKRVWSASGFAQIQAANNAITLNGEYGDTSTNLTSISIVGNQSAGLSTECFIHAIRIQASNPLA